MNLDQTIIRCQQGDTAAFDLLLNRYQRQVYELACAIMRDEEGAKDAMQDSFVRIYQRLNSYQGQSAFETWLTAVVVNCCRDHLRRRQIRQTLSLDHLLPNWLYRASQPEQQPDRQIERQDERQTIWASVDQLDDKYRLTLILRYRFGLTCAEIGSVLGIATTTVYGRLNEGRKLLLQLLEEKGIGRHETTFW